MRAAIGLGVRLAGVGARRGSVRAGSLRSAMVALAASVGTLLLLCVAAIARSEQGRPDDGLVSHSGRSILLVTVFIAVALPVLVLAATAGRLAAAMRDRRLANLRLLGLSPGLTRLVAVVETGSCAVAGTLMGWAGFLLLRPILAPWRPTGRDWTTSSLHPTWLDYLVVVLLIPVAVVLVSSVPQRMSSADALAQVKRSTAARPRWWRLAPLLLGTALTTYVLIGSDPDRDNTRLIPYLFSGITLLGLGVILTVPIFVRLVADLLIRRADHPSLVVAGRRLQMQPASMTRVVAGLLIGLFVVTGARAVVVAFEQTPQYQSAARMKTTGLVAYLETSAHQATAVQQALTGVDDIRHTLALPTLGIPCGDSRGSCLRAVVSTCAELRAAFGDLPGCRDSEPMWLVDPETWLGDPLLPAGITRESSSLPWQRLSRQFAAVGPTVPVTMPDRRLDGSDSVHDAINAEIFIPRSTTGIGSTLGRTRVTVLAVARPGVDLLSNLRLLPTGLAGWSVPDGSYYNFVAGLREMVWAIGSVILSVGLLAFAIAATDRAMQRRQEVMALQLLGMSSRVLRRIQWVEAALPLVCGIVLAVGLGALAGSAYLAFGAEVSAAPWPQTLLIAGVSLASAVAVAGLTVIAASPTIRPELIRAE